MCRIILSKCNGYVHMPCMFCDGQVLTDLDINHDDNTVTMKGLCKKCQSYILIRTNRSNVVTNWECKMDKIAIKS
jgi:hypothetical protein